MLSNKDDLKFDIKKGILKADGTFLNKGQAVLPVDQQIAPPAVDLVLGLMDGGTHYEN